MTLTSAPTPCARSAGEDADQTIITNGILLNRRGVEDLQPLVELSFSGIKVTLRRGTRAHDRMRPLRGRQAGEAVDRIIENVKPRG